MLHAERTIPHSDHKKEVKIKEPADDRSHKVTEAMEAVQPYLN